MLLICPQCKTKYRLPDYMIMAQAHCSKCGKTWKLEPDKEEIIAQFKAEKENLSEEKLAEEKFKDSITDPNETFPETLNFSANEPEIKPIKNVFKVDESKKEQQYLKKLRPLLYTIITLICLGSYAFFFHPFSKYPLQIKSLSFKFVEIDYVTTLQVTTVLQNVSNDTIELNDVDVEFRNDRDFIMSKSPLTFEKTMLKPGEEKTVTMQSGRPPSTASNAKIQIGKISKVVQFEK
ncbi:MAG: zinc-ribbon domain-containing protein [Alphaproteobacteria bacterium]|nr:zinc-ribbon domain-containing protein [Alphaproteobacteria bacterium]